MTTLLRCCVVAMLVLLSGCGSSPVADDLSQRDANRIVAALRSKGVDSSTEKERGSRGRYTVVVASADFAKAASFLAELGLPEERQASFSELVAQSGFLPSSKDVESLRLDRALAAEIEDLLRGHPAVSDAHVVVRHHALTAGAASTITTVVQKRAGSGVTTDEVQAMVSRSLPNVRAEDISVTIAEQRVVIPGAEESVDSAHAPVPFLLYWRVPADQYNGLAGLMIGLLIFVATLAGLGGYIFGQYTLSKHHVLGRSQRVETRPAVVKTASPSAGELEEDKE